MNNKSELVTMLNEEFGRWQELLNRLDEEQINARQLPGGWSVKDVVAHLMTWQRRTLARMEAALSGGEPHLPDWPAHLNPNAEEDLEAINAWIFDQHRNRPWEAVYRDWRSGFERLLELAEAVPEPNLLTPGQYAWLGGYPLAAVLEGTYNHHQEEHREPLEAWLRG